MFDECTVHLPPTLHTTTVREFPSRAGTREAAQRAKAPTLSPVAGETVQLSSARHPVVILRPSLRLTLTPRTMEYTAPPSRTGATTSRSGTQLEQTRVPHSWRFFSKEFILVGPPPSRRSYEGGDSALLPARSEPTPTTEFMSYIPDKFANTTRSSDVALPLIQPPVRPSERAGGGVAPPPWFVPTRPNQSRRGQALTVVAPPASPAPTPKIAVDADRESIRSQNNVTSSKPKVTWTTQALASQPSLDGVGPRLYIPDMPLDAQMNRIITRGAGDLEGVLGENMETFMAQLDKAMSTSTSSEQLLSSGYLRNHSLSHAHIASDVPLSLMHNSTVVNGKIVPIHVGVFAETSSKTLRSSHNIGHNRPMSPISYPSSGEHLGTAYHKLTSTAVEEQKRSLLEKQGGGTLTNPERREYLRDLFQSQRQSEHILKELKID